MKSFITDKNTLNDKGSALLYVLIMALMLTMVVSSVLAASANAVRQSSFSENYEQTYYTAESALLIAAEMFMIDFVNPPENKDNKFHIMMVYDSPVATLSDIPPTYVTDLENSFRTSLQASMRELFSSTTNYLNAHLTVNDQRPHIMSGDLIIRPASVIVAHEKYILNETLVRDEDTDEIIGTLYEVSIAVYLQEVEYTIRGTVRDADNVMPRMVELSYSFVGSMYASGEFVDLPPVTVTEGDDGEVDLTLGGRNGQFTQNDAAALADYARFRVYLENLLNTAKDFEHDIRTNLEGMDYTSANGNSFSGGGTASVPILASDARLNHTRVQSTETLYLGGSLTGNRATTVTGTSTYSGTGRNDELEYLYVMGDLIICGQMYFPNLKEVYVTGKVHISGNNRIFAGIDRREGSDAQIVGTRFVVGGENLPGSPIPASQAQLHIDAPTTRNTVFDTRFYVPRTININANHNTSLVGNAVYIAYDSGANIDVGTNGNAMFLGAERGNEGATPFAAQFYSMGNIVVRGQGNVHFHALFAAMNNINVPSGSNIDLHGFALGGSGSIPNFSPNTMTANRVTNLLDYGLLFNSRTTTTIRRERTLSDPVYTLSSGSRSRKIVEIEP
jgi:hypothetical protein